MDSDHVEIVRFALAFHLEIDIAEVHLAQRLEEDLGLDPLDLVLVVLRLEELGDIEFPVADLEGIRTVSDLVDVVRAWCADPEAMATLAPPAPQPTESGFRLAVTREEVAAYDSRRAG